MSAPSHIQAAKAGHGLNIVHVVDSLEFGGLERVVTDLAKAQLAAGHRVSVFSINTTDGLKPELLAAGIPVLEGHKKNSLDRHTLSTLRHCVRDQRIDVVHAHNFVPNYYAAFAMMGLRQRPALVCTLHDMGMRLSNRKLRWLFKWSLTRTAQVAMVGKQVHDRYLSWGMVKPDRVHTVLNGIPVDRFVNTPERRARARAELGLANDDLVVGCVGRLVPLKNHHRMIEVMPELLLRHPKVKLLIIGDGERRQALANQVSDLNVKDSVLLAGHRNKVSDLLPAIDLFALPSQTEGLSIALLEACATGLCVVATNVGGNPEIIRDRHSGLLVPVDDNAALSKAIDTLISDPDLRQRYGQQGSEWVREHASDDTLRKAYDHCYAKALRG